MIRLDGKVAIVTGATQGLGADIAATLSEAGAATVIVGRGRAQGEAVAATLGGSAWFSETDLADDAAIERCVAETVARFGRIDILVNNACIYADPGLGATRAQWRAALDVNLIGAAILTDQAVAHMPPGGVVINIGSIGGKFGAAGRALYPASKAALMQLTKNAAVTLAPRGIRVLTVSPAWTWSPAVEALAGTVETADRIGALTHPVGRVGRGRDVGNAVVFACSDMASFMTGVDLAVDGGYSILGPDRGLGPRPWLTGEVSDREPS